MKKLFCMLLALVMLASCAVSAVAEEKYLGVMLSTNVMSLDTNLATDGESFEVIATGDQLPGVEFVITDEYGEYNFKFETVFRNGNRKTPDAPVDFLIFHNYDEGEIGIWVSALYDEDADQFEYYADDDGQDEEADCPGLYRVFVYAAVYEAVE